MALVPGTRLGPYEIIGLIGAGGMGEVYRARDPRLNRTVAIKVSRERFSDRFDREARTLAGMNHAHICQIYDVGPNYLVMEMIDGRPLTGPLPLDQTLEYGRQICDALDIAHRKGIVHRDLKPANILATKGGIKLLDFGLAKTAGATLNAASSPDDTVTRVLTGRHEIVGTLQYMSPEQLQPDVRQVDARTDIFSFGLVLYEMLTGRKAFDGSSAASIIAAILERPAPSIADVAPSALDRVLKRCLAKDPDDRWQSARDLGVQLEWITTPVAESTPAAARRLNTKVPWAMAGLAMLVAVTASYLAWKPAPLPEPVRLEMDGPRGAPLTIPVISPDGRTVAFFAGQAGKQKLFLRPLDAAGPRTLEGTEGGYSPFWSPDGRFVGYLHPRGDLMAEVKKLAIAGGSPQTLGEVPRGISGSWSRDGVILVSPSLFGPLYRVSANGGPVKEATALDAGRGETSQRWPSFLPDGRHFLFLSLSKNPANAGIFVGRLDSNERTPLNGEISSALYAAGHLLFVKDQTLMAQPFDATRLQLSGEPVPLFENIGFAPPVWLGMFSASDNGNLAALAARARGGRQLTWLDRSGKPAGTIGEPADLLDPVLSPDGRRVAILRGNGVGALSLQILDPDRGLFSTLGSEGASSAGGGMVFSPDSKRIAFSGRRGDSIRLMAVDGGPETTLPEIRGVPEDWSADGRYLVYRGQQGSLWILPSAGGDQPFEFLENAGSGRFSPDSNWLAYVKSSQGNLQVYAEPFSGGPSKGARRIQVSLAGGTEPTWSSDGKELFYISSDRKLMASPIQLGPTLSVSVPKALFEIPADVRYAVSSNGQRFLLNLSVERAAEPPITVMLNWPSVLNR